MTSRGETPPAVQARVVLEPLKTQKTDGRSPEQKKRMRAEDEEKEKEKEKGTEVKPQSSLQAVKEPCPVPDLRAQAGDIERSVLAFCWTPTKK
jgi:hypothetical protein